VTFDFRSLLRTLTLAALASASGPVAPAETETARAINIPAGPAAHTLIREFADQTGLQLLVDFEEIRNLDTPAVTGQLTASETLARMLEGTRLTFEFVNEWTVAIVPKPDSALADGASGLDGRGAGQSESSDLERGDRGYAFESPSDLRLEDLEQVLVLGTYFRGMAPVGAQAITIRRSDINRTGYATVQDVVRALPQNFGGGPSEDTTLGYEAGTNSSRGTALNLRGLGASATLVLLNGRRLAPGGTEGAFVDVSDIPLSAIEQIDILPDGGSALYGSDSVGGVVNFTLRENYVGRETQLRAGAVTSGALDEYQFSQLVGTRWENGNGLLALEYYDRGRLPADDRPQMASDLRPFGGDNFDTERGNPGTIIIGSQRWAIPRGQDGRSLTASDLTAGTANLHNRQEGRDVLSEQERLSILGTLRHAPTERVKLFTDALFVQRDVYARDPALTTDLLVPTTNPFHVNPAADTVPVVVGYSFRDDLGPITSDVRVRTANFAFGAVIDAGAGWRISTTAGHAHSGEDGRIDAFVDFTALTKALADSNPETAFNPFGDGSHTNPSTLSVIRASSVFDAESDVGSISAVAEGPIGSLPGGAARAAIGVEYRRDTFDWSLRTVSRADPTGEATARSNSLERDARAAFMELLVPVIGAGNRRRGFERLQFSASSRYELYDDFGSTLTPRLGVSWAPTSTVVLRGTRSKSFRAPNMYRLDESGSGSMIVPLADPLSTRGASSALLWFGGNADLQEERADAWTAGLDFASSTLPGLSVSATYFSIEFEDQIRNIPISAGILLNPDYRDAVYRSPSPEQRERVCSRSRFVGIPGACNSAAIDLLIDARSNNVATVRTRGLDLVSSYELESAIGSFDFGLNASYVFEYSQAVRVGAPLKDLLDTEHSPVALRARGSLSWERRAVGAAAFFSYSDDYRDTISLPERRIGSWTTVDLQLSYRATDHGFLGKAGTRFSLNIRNVFDEDPPFVNNSSGLGFDPENADLLGRLVSFQVRRDW
jgi:iron complex outermembrane receptor protein